MRLLQTLIQQADEGKLSAIRAQDNDLVTDPDFREINRQIFECGMTAYGAAKCVYDSGMSVRSLRTLAYHAHQIEVHLLNFLGGISVSSLVKLIQAEGEVECPDELVSEMEKYIAGSELQVEKVTVFRSIAPHTKG